jgi:hypothetical protein
VTSITGLVLHPPYTARVKDGALHFDLFEPWYRSLPVSCITGLDVTVDGAPVPAGDLSITIGGQTRTLAECAQAWEEFWFVQDPAVVRVPGVGTGGHAHIGVHLSMRIPYIMIGPATALPHHAFGEETFEVTR